MAVYLILVEGAELPSRSAMVEAVTQCSDSVSLKSLVHGAVATCKLGEVFTDTTQTITVTNSKRSFFGQIGMRSDKTFWAK